MHSKLAGHLPLQDMLTAALEGARAKLAAAEEKKDEKKAPPFAKKDEKKDEAEKKASAIFTSADEVEKLASALEEAADEIVKEADSIENGGESKQGGEQLATQSPTGGTQPYSKDGSKKHQPKVGELTSTPGPNAGPATAMPTDDKRAPGGNGAKYPEKGVLKTAGESVMDKIKAKKEEGEKKAPPPFAKKDDDKGEEKDEKKSPPPFAKKDDDKGDEGKDKKSAAQIVAEKVAEFHGGGETLDDKSAPVPMVPGRSLIQNKDGIKNVTKAQAKAPRKAEIAQVLTEPAMTKSTDNKVHENLRNAAKGGVKIAAAKVLLQKIAAEGCKCEDKGTCPSCKLKSAVEKKRAEKKA